MSRSLRLEFAGALYHITSRGNERRPIFRDDEDRSGFLGRLTQEVATRGWRCHAYCLMGNHYHLLLETPAPNLSGGMRRLNAGYAQSFNRRHGRSGHLLQGRYHAILVEKESYLLELARYIELNPVRAGMVTHPGAWPWSSYRATAGLAAAPDFLTTTDLLGCFSELSLEKARAEYEAFVGEGMGRRPLEEVRGGVWLGGARFRAGMAARLGAGGRRGVPSHQQEPARMTADQVLTRVCEAYGSTAADLLSRRHQQPYRAAVFLLRRLAGLPIREVAARFVISRARVSAIQRCIERGGPDEVLRLLMDQSTHPRLSEPTRSYTYKSELRPHPRQSIGPRARTPLETSV